MLIHTKILTCTHIHTLRCTCTRAQMFTCIHMHTHIGIHTSPPSTNEPQKYTGAHKHRAVQGCAARHTCRYTGIHAYLVITEVHTNSHDRPKPQRYVYARSDMHRDTGKQTQMETE